MHFHDTHTRVTKYELPNKFVVLTETIIGCRTRSSQLVYLLSMTVSLTDVHCIIFVFCAILIRRDLRKPVLFMINLTKHRTKQPTQCVSRITIFGVISFDMQIHFRSTSRLVGFVVMLCYWLWCKGFLQMYGWPSSQHD